MSFNHQRTGANWPLIVALIVNFALWASIIALALVLLGGST